MRAIQIIGTGVLLSASVSFGENPRGGWEGKGNAGITLSRGNGESLRGTAELEGSRSLGDWQMEAAASLLYGRDNGVSSGERVDGSFQLNRGQKSRIYAGLSGEILHDQPARINWRAIVSPVIGWRAFDQENLELDLEVGPGLTWEDRASVTRGYSSVRLHEHLGIQLTKRLHFFQSLTAIFEAGDLENYSVKADAGLESKLGGSWLLRLAAKAVFHGDSDQTASEDLLLTAGFGYNLHPADQSEGVLASGVKKLKSRSGEWGATALLGGSISKGNSDARSISSGLRLRRDWNDNELVAGIFGVYGQQGGTMSAESLSGDLHYQQNLAKESFGGMRLDCDYDALAELDWRLAFAPYFGWVVFETERGKLSLEGGPSVVAEQKSGRERAFLATYAAVKAKHKLGERTQLVGELSWLTKAADFKSQIFTSELRVEHALSERLSLQLLGRSTYDTDPANNSGRHDLQVVSALAVRF